MVALNYREIKQNPRRVSNVEPFIIRGGSRTAVTSIMERLVIIVNG